MRQILLALPIFPSDGRRGAQEDGALVEEAVRRARRGDRAGVHFLYVRFAADVQRSIAGLVHDQREAEDITQAVFAKLPTSIARCEHGDVPFATWVRLLARTAALDAHLRWA